MERDTRSLSDRSGDGTIEHLDANPDENNALLSRPNVPWDNWRELPTCACQSVHELDEFVVCRECLTAYDRHEYFQLMVDHVVATVHALLARAIDEPGGPSANAGGEA